MPADRSLITCAQVVDVLDAVADGSHRLDPAARRHVEQCLQCQADLARYRRLLRALHTLRSQVADPPPGLVGDILAALEEAGERRAVLAVLQGRRAAYIGGIAAATAAGAAGAIVLATRNRRLRPAS